MPIAKASLGQPSFLAKGGFGQVFRVDSFRLPNDQTPLAYKEFTSARSEQARSAEAAVDFRAGLSHADRDELDLYCAWPRALVEDAGGIAGLLMPLIPKDFFVRQMDPDSGNPTSKPCDMSWLIATAAQRRAAQINLPDLDDADRLILLGQLVYAIGRLHKHGWVFGDLSFKNAVFAVNPPRLMLLDCDGAAPLNDLRRKQASTPFWDPPECPITPPRLQERQDTVTDAYKLGLAILRGLTPGKGAASSRAATRLAGELDPQGIDFITRAVGEDRGLRPTAKELYGYLYRTVAARIKPPEVLAARLVSHFLVRGMDARVEWRIENAERVTVSVGHGSPFPVDPAVHPNGYVFRPDESGPVLIEASNRFGAVRANLGEITLYELPPFHVDLNYLPRPQIPDMEAFSTEQLRSMLGADIRVRMPEVPPVPSLRTLDLLDGLRPSPAVTVSLPRISDSILEASQTAANMAMKVAREYASAQRKIHPESEQR